MILHLVPKLISVLKNFNHTNLLRLPLLEVLRIQSSFYYKLQLHMWHQLSLVVHLQITFSNLCKYSFPSSFLFQPQHIMKYDSNDNTSQTCIDLLVLIKLGGII